MGRTMNLDFDDYQRSMRDAGVRERRTSMLHQPHIQPLTAYVSKLRKRGSGEVPDFDPLDATTMTPRRKPRSSSWSALGYLES